MTYKGESNLEGTLRRPSAGYSLSVNGDQHIDTGMGKWTHLSALGVERHLIYLGLAESVEVQRTKWDTPFEMLDITSMGKS